jgi:hypothetical protein
VRLVKVDVVGVQALEAGFGLGDNVLACQARVVGALAHRATHFGGQNYIVAVHAQVAQRLAGNLFRVSLGIHVGRVDEVDARVERALSKGISTGLVDAADGTKAAAGGAEGHGAQAKLRYF